MKTSGDLSVPGLSTALDTNAMPGLLWRSLPELHETLELAGGQILDVRYLPGSHCVVLYRMDLTIRSSGHPVDQLLNARFLRRGEQVPGVPRDLATRFDALSKRWVRSPAIYLDEVHAVIHPFPVDPALPWLFEALDPTAMRERLSRSLGQRQSRVLEVTPRLLRYVPQARATLLYEVQAECRRDGTQEQRRLVGKLHPLKRPSTLYANTLALWRAAGDRARLARPAGYVGPMHLTLQEYVQGQRLDCYVGTSYFLPLVQQTARAIAAVHRLDAPLTSRRSPREEAQVVHRYAEVLGAVCPGLACHIGRLRDELAGRIEECAQASGPVHGDFDSANVLTDGQDVTLIDFDFVAYGDPLADVGRFLASLRLLARHKPGEADRLEAAAAAFVEEYRTIAPVDDARLRLFEAASLLTTAAVAFRQQGRRWGEDVAALVEAAERVVRTNAPKSVGTSAPGKAPASARSLEERIRWATDCDYMRATLDPVVERAFGAVAAACRVSRARHSGSSSTIRYELTGWHGDSEWTMLLDGLLWRERNRRMLRQQLMAIREALKDHPDAPLLPRPIGYLPQLSMLLVEAPPKGRRLSSLIDSPDGRVAAAKAARALAALHEAQVVDAGWDPREEIPGLRRALERLEELRPDLHARAIPLLVEVERQWRAAPAGRSRSVRPLHPRQTLYVGDRIAFVGIDDVTTAHPYLDVGNFLARLALIGIRENKASDAAAIADQFRETYADAAAAHCEAVTAFEAAALVRLACARATPATQADPAEELLTSAAKTLVSGA